MRRITSCVLATALICLALINSTACRTASGNNAKPPVSPACEIALAAHSGDLPLDQEIARLQQDLRSNRRPQQTSALIEKLGWKYVEKARISFDPGYYKLAEQCAICLQCQLGEDQVKSQETTKAGAQADTKPLQSSKSIHASALLLRGHVLHNLHRFAEAEVLARELVAVRGIAYDYGLLGDVLLEQGKMDEATAAYQKMMDQRPSPQAYSRSAYLHWLRGDLVAARTLMNMAAEASGQGDPEATAWTWSKLAGYELQVGAFKRAHNLCDAALEMEANYAPALLARGRTLLAEGRTNEAVATLERAAQINPLPDYQWTLAEALRAADRQDEAVQVESKLLAKGEANDPRTLALFLATRGEQTDKALKLAQNEMKVRQDVFTLDALAWAQAANGENAEAWKTMQTALAPGTIDARLFMHAATIAARAGDKKQANIYASKAAKYQDTLLPSEKIRLKSLKSA